MNHLVWISALWGMSLFLACTSPDKKNPQIGGGILDETETIASGTIVDSLGSPVALCSLSLRSSSPVKETTFVTGTSGEFSFEHLPPGTYVLMASAGRINQGLQVRFTLEQGESMTWTQPLTMQKLTFLNITREQACNADSVWIPELGKSFAVPSSIPSVPVGSYTIVPLDSDSATTPIIIPAGTNSSFASSVNASSSSQKLYSISLSSSSQSRSNPSSSSARSSSSLPLSSSAISSPPSNGENTFLWNGSSGSLSDARDGQTYAIVAFDSLYWFAQNLRYNGNGSTCNPNDTYAETGECFEFGRFYSQDQAQISCPDGWRLPSIEEWQTALYAAGGYATAGLQLKSVNYWNSLAGTDDLHFSILPAGTSGTPKIGDEAYFWTTTKADAAFYYAVYASSTGSAIQMVNVSATEGLSVRCVMNKN